MTVLLVTGASRGIGLALVGHLHRRGHQVVAACRDPDTSDELAAIGAPVVALDVTDRTSLASFADRVRAHTDRVDVLVNNAGIKQSSGQEWEASAGPMPALDPAAVIDVLATNVVGALAVTQAVLDLLPRPGGVVANISSMLASFEQGVGVDYAYNASKAALNMVTVTMDRDLGRFGIVPVSINPGWIRTAMGGDDAPLAVDEATADLASLLVRLDGSFAGRFVDRNGGPMPW